MFNPGNNTPFGGRRRGNTLFGGSNYPYQGMSAGYENAQAGSLISKVMLLLAFSFIFASIGAFIGTSVFSIYPSAVGLYLIALFGSFGVLLILRLAIQVPGLNLFLLYLFTALFGFSLSPLILSYLGAGLGNILGEAFLITAVTSLGLAAYAWTTRRNFMGIGRYLFWGLLLLIVLGILGFFFQGLFSTGILGLFVSLLGVAIFSGFVLYHVQQAKYMADTLPNAIMLTASIFVTVMNLFLYILQFLTILQGGNRRR